MMSATCAKPSVRSRCAARGRREARPAGRRPRPCRPRGSARRAAPSTTGAVLRRAHEQPADVRVRAQRRDQLRVARVDLLERQPARLVHQVDEAEVAGAEHDDVASPQTSFFARFSLAVPVASATAWPTAIASARRRRRPPPRRRASSERSTSSSSAVAVALLERRALRLAVVGEHDDLVRARRVAARALDAAELLVELAQRLERVGALEAGVVRDLVVARERRVDGGPAAHHVRRARRTTIRSRTKTHIAARRNG